MSTYCPPEHEPLGGTSKTLTGSEESDFLRIHDAPFGLKAVNIPSISGHVFFVMSTELSLFFLIDVAAGTVMLGATMSAGSRVCRACAVILHVYVHHAQKFIVALKHEHIFSAYSLTAQ